MKTQNIPENVEKYFKNGPRKIKKVLPKENYTLEIIFDNNERRIYDMSNNLFGVFEFLKNIDNFKKVFIDENGNIAWLNEESKRELSKKVDICKDSVYLESKKIDN